MEPPTDPRLAVLYDIDNPGGADHEHYRQLAARLEARTIVDLGCGTGLLTVTLAGGGRTVTGIDPDAGMLDVARRRDGGDQVAWLLGDSRRIGDAHADLVLMTGNAAQHVVPTDWSRTLADIAAGLRTGGRLSFECRNPTVAAWRSWTTAATRSTRDTPSGRLSEWMEATEPDEHGTVVLVAHNVWEATGEHLVVSERITFRGVEQVSADLEAAGLAVAAVAGGWHGETFGDDSALMVVEAVRRA